MPDPKKEIIKAAKSGQVDRIKMLLAENVDLIHARDTDDSTPLHCAVWKGHADAVAILLAAGADPNARNNNGHWGTTPLHAAAHANQAVIAQLLIDHGGDVNGLDLDGKTPLHHTTFHKANAAAKVLLKNGATS